MVRTLLRAGHRPLVVDNLSTGHREAVPREAVFLKADIVDRRRITQAMRSHGTEAVFHFASRIQVGESVTNPRLYFTSNLGASIALLESTLEAGVGHFILSSTAAVYGRPVHVPIDESHPTEPVNPYGETKLATEWMLAAYGRAYGLRFAALRYFNAAGADPDDPCGERHVPETHLIPIVLEAAAGLREAVTVYGTDYGTPDGTCIRDYVHISDLCEAHLAALEYLRRGGESGAFNLGTGIGHSVNEVIQAAERVSGRKVPVMYGPRRHGDPPSLVASAARASQRLGWRPRRPRLDDMIGDAWAALMRGAAAPAHHALVGDESSPYIS